MRELEAKSEARKNKYCQQWRWKRPSRDFNKTTSNRSLFDSGTLDSQCFIHVLAKKDCSADIVLMGNDDNNTIRIGTIKIRLLDSIRTMGNVCHTSGS